MRDLLKHALEVELPGDETAERIMGAALTQAEDFGLRRFTVDDVARRVGLSRVTIYRYFPKKDQLLNALVLREMKRFLTKVDAVVEAQATPEEKLIEGLSFSLGYLRGHRLLNRLLRTEPELILPQLTVQAGGLFAAARTRIAAHFHAEIAAGRLSLPAEDVDGMAELLIRIVVSLVLTQETVLPVDDDVQRRRLAELYLAPLAASRLVRDGFRDPGRHRQVPVQALDRQPDRPPQRLQHQAVHLVGRRVGQGDLHLLLCRLRVAVDLRQQRADGGPHRRVGLVDRDLFAVLVEDLDLHRRAAAVPEGGDHRAALAEQQQHQRFRLVRAGLGFGGRRRDLDEGFGVVTEAQRRQRALSLLDELLLVPVRIHVPHQTPATAVVGIP
jgi:AcrR family transcriptional regulator